MKRPLIYFFILLPPLAAAAALGWVYQRQREARKGAVDRKELLASAAVGAPPSSEDPLVKKGWEVYTQRGCVYCHGVGGEGGVENPNFKGKTMPALKKLVSTYTDEELREKIRTGVANSDREDPNGPPPALWMPAWRGVLSDSELNSLISYLRFLAPAEEGWGG